MPVLLGRYALVREAHPTRLPATIMQRASSVMYALRTLSVDTEESAVEDLAHVQRDSEDPTAASSIVG